MKFSPSSWILNRGFSNGADRRQRGKRRRAETRLSHTRLATEALEQRALLSVAPAPQPSTAVDVTSSLLLSDETSPSIAIDPLDSSRVVTVFTREDEVTDVHRVEGRYSRDGGQTWAAFNISRNLQLGNPDVPAYRQASDASVAFDANHRFFVVYGTRNDGNSNGSIVLQGFRFDGSAPASTLQITLKLWSLDQAITPTIAIDNSVATFVDPDTGATQTNPLAGNIYVAWSTVEQGVANPNVVKMVVSSDGGASFSAERILNDSPLGSTAWEGRAGVRPQLVVSQGSRQGAATAGQVTVIWNDFQTRFVPGLGTVNGIVSDRVRNGGVGAEFNTGGGAIRDAAQGRNGLPDRPRMTVFPLNVNITDAEFGQLTDLDVSLVLTHPDLTQLKVELLPPGVATGVSQVIDPHFIVFGPDVSGDAYPDLYVTSTSDDSVLRLNGITGALIDKFITPGLGGLDGPQAIVFGPNGNLFIASQLNNRVLEYNAATGAFVRTFVAANSGQLTRPTGLVFGPDGNLYVSSRDNNRILRYSGVTGAFINTFASGNSLNAPQGLMFGADGNADDILDLYVASSGNDAVLRFSGGNGAFIDAFVPAATGGIDSPMDLTFDGTGNLYVTSFNTDSVAQFDSLGVSLGDFIPAKLAGLDEPVGLRFGPDGNLYVASSKTDEILRYSGIDGNFLSYSTGVASPVAPRGLLFDPGQLLAMDAGDSSILRFNLPSGLYLGSYSVLSSAPSPMAAVRGPDGNLYVTSLSTGAVVKLDGTTFAGIGTFAGGMTSARYLDFGPDLNADAVGDLFVADFGANVIRSFDGVTGLAISTFGDTILVSPNGVAFGPDVTGDGIADLIVTGSGSNNIVRFDVVTGTLIDEFVPPGIGGLSNPADLTIGPDGQLYVSSQGNHSVLRFDLTTGAAIDAFVPAGTAGLSSPDGLRFGPDDDLYVSSTGSQQILRFDGATGAFIDDFSGQANLGNGGLQGPEGIVLRSDGSLLVASSATDEVKSYNGTTGAFNGNLVSAGSGGLDNPASVIVTPGGQVLAVSPNTDSIVRYDGTSGALIDAFLTGNGLNDPRDIVIGPDGQLYVANRGGGNILRFDPITGALVDVFAQTGPGAGPEAIAFDAAGDLYVSAGDQVLAFSGIDGQSLGVFASGNGLSDASGLAFGSDGHLYVASRAGNAVLKYHGITGVFMNAFVPSGSGGLDGPARILFGPNSELYVSSSRSNQVLVYDTQGVFIDELVTALGSTTGGGGARKLPTLTLVEQATGLTVSGTSLGENISTSTTNPVYVPVVFDNESSRTLIDGTRSSPFAGHFRPANLGNRTLAEYYGVTPASLNGKWNVRVTDFVFDANQEAAVVSVGVKLTSALTPGLDRTVALTSVIGSDDGNFPLTTPASPDFGVGPGAVIAADNTLGSFSPYQGRLYVAYTDRIDDPREPRDDTPFDNTDIFIRTSDDGGLTWSAARRVNDDNPYLDGFSAGDRPQFGPSLAVDQSTGALAVSYFDARYDAARARVARFVGLSIDGGESFSQQTFVNPSQIAFDSASRSQVGLGPIPDNQSVGNAARDVDFGFGERQGLAAVNGKLLVAWAGNANGGVRGDQLLDIYVNPVKISAGPRVVSGTMGPVTADLNDTFAADGTRQFRVFDVEFDRPVDPATFTQDDVQVQYRDTVTRVNTPAVPVAVDGVDALDLGLFGPARAAGATRFRIRLVEPQSRVGTYSYAIGPNVSDRVRSRSRNGNAMDQNANGTAGQATDAFAVPRPLNDIPFLPNYDSLTLPMIVPGPHVVATSVPQGVGADNLRIDGIVSSVDVTFDRDMAPGSFTPGDILRIMGPQGRIDAPTPFQSRDVRIPIPDGGGAIDKPLVSTVLIPADGNTFLIKDLDVLVDIEHPRDQELTLTLIAPDGTRIALADRVGGTRGNFTGTTFDDEAAQSIVSGVPPFTGSYRPMAPLSAFDGKPLQGQWKLEIVDHSHFNRGQLNGWTLIATPVIGVTPVTAGAPDPAHPRTFRIDIPGQAIGGAYQISLGSTISSAAGDLLDTNRNAGVDVLRDVDPLGRTTPVVVNATGLPLSIPDATRPPNTNTITPGVVQSSLRVTENFVIQDLDLQLKITHASDPDLAATLIFTPDDGAPPTRVQLFSRIGATGTRANFNNTIFDDSATTPIQNGGPPFFGRFTPQFPLADLNGKLSAGVFTLEIKDFVLGNAGTLDSWSLTFKKALPGTGLGEPVGDRATVGFRVFSMDPTNPVSTSGWTQVGPASINGQQRSGRVSAIAVDPSDPSGNTVYIGGASGGIWRTNNFLTTDSLGPNYSPLTDFGPGFAINIGGITLVPRNNDPNQTIVFASTGEGDTNSPGVGFLRSMDGGATWTFLDSTRNVDDFGNPLAITDRLRDHIFLGTTSFKIVADPTLSPAGEAIVYAALGSGTNFVQDPGGIWRSVDSGKTWQKMTDPLVHGTQATDIVMDFNSRSVSTGNLQVVYAAMQGAGVFISPNRGQVWNLMAGTIGDPLIQDGDVPGNVPIPVDNPNAPPQASSGRIVLSKPGLTGDPLQDLLQQGWLYAATVSGENLDGLFITKDFGQNWTRVQIPTLPNHPFFGPQAIPSNDVDLADYDVAGGNGTSRGSYAVSLAVDPNDPNIVYLGGSWYRNLEGDAQPSGLLRVDTTRLFDPHALVAYTHFLPDGGALGANTEGRALHKDPLRTLPTPILNLLADPANPFITNATVKVRNVAGFTNTGAGATWTPIDLKGIAGEANGMHRIVSMVDPLTGRTRLLFGADNGVYSGVDGGFGQVVTEIGTVEAPIGPRNGNLQITQIYFGAAQPTQLAADVAGAMFYAQTKDTGFVQSDPRVLTNGDLRWFELPGDTPVEGTGVATDPQAESTLYQFNWPAGGGRGTDFFQVDKVGRTFGLLQVPDGPDPQWPFETGSNFAVNPLDGDQIMVSSQAGRIFGTENQGRFWLEIGNPDALRGIADEEPSYAQALAFGAPDPRGPGGIGNLNNLIYAGTVEVPGITRGKIFVSQTGGGASGNDWTDISGGLDGSSVMAIVTNPERGSHEAYAVTMDGVYWMPDSSVVGAGWRPIGSGLFRVLTTNPFDDPIMAQSPLRYLTSIVADWRYQLPDDPTDPASPTHPILYVGGEGGVFRSVDKGLVWTVFPDVPDGARHTGGYLPVAHVTDLDLVLGPINRETGQPAQSVGPGLLVASTFGRGMFALRLGPTVVNSELYPLGLDPNLPFGPERGGSDSSYAGVKRGNPLYFDDVTRVAAPVIGGWGGKSAFGDAIQVRMFDLTGDPLNPNAIPFVAGTDFTDGTGRFAIQVAPGYFADDGSEDGVKTIGVQLTDSSGIVGQLQTFTFTLDTTAPVSPAEPDLTPESDLGPSNADNVTKANALAFTGQVEPDGRDTPIELFLDNDPTPLVKGFATAATGNYALFVDTPLPEGTYLVRLRQTDIAGNVGQLGAPLTLVIDRTAPPKPLPPSLDPATDSGLSNADGRTNIANPVFVGVVASDFADGLVELFADGGFDTPVGAGSADKTTGAYRITLTEPLGLGTHTLQARHTDAAGNVGEISEVIQVTIDQTPPSAPGAPDLTPATDGGSSNSDNFTSHTLPDFQGVVETDVTNTLVQLFLDDDLVNPIAQGSAEAATGRYLMRLTTPLTNGPHRIRAKQTDVAGNVSPISPALEIVIDTVAPGKPAPPDLTATTDSGLSSTDNVTRITRPQFQGTVETDLLDTFVEVFAEGVVAPVGRGTASATTGQYVILIDTALTNGARQVRVRQIDAAGNASPLSDPLSIVVDAVAPSRPGAPDLTPASDSGVSNADNLTNAVRPEIQGTVATDLADTLVIVYADGNLNTAVGQGLANGATGAYKFAIATALAVGTHTLQATQTDLAGNVSPISTSLTVVIDTSVPRPAAPRLSAATDAGSSASDGITNLTGLEVEGVGATDVAATEIRVYVDGDTATSRGTGTANAATGAYKFAITGAFAEGTHTLQVEQVDAAGNVSLLSLAYAIVVDLTAPAKPAAAPDLTPDSDTGLSNTDNLTADVTPSFQGTVGTDAADGRVQIFADGGALPIGDGPANAGSGAYLSTVTDALASGTYGIRVRHVDAAGNVGPLSDALQIRVDTTTPPTPAAPDLTAATDSGVSDADDLTRVPRPQFAGTAAPDVANTFVEIFADGDLTTPVGSGAADAATGAYSITLGSDLADGAHDIRVRQTNVIGNLSPLSPALRVTIDSVAPAPGTPDLLAASDTGSSSTDNITSNRQPSFSGSARPESNVSLVELFVDGIATALGSAAVDPTTGAYQVALNAVLDEGVRVIRARQTDLAGNVSPLSIGLTSFIDATPPARPAAPDLTPDTDSGASNSDNVTVIVRPKFQGNVEPDRAATIVQIFANGGATPVGQGTANATTGAYLITLSTDLPGGANDIQVRQIDAAGNASPLSPPLRVVVNTAPVARDDEFILQRNRPLGIADGANVLANDSDAEGDPLRAVLVRGPALGSFTLDANGAVSFSPGPNFKGIDTFTYLANDGNRDSAVATATLISAEYRMARDLYRVVLFREGSPAELQYWASLIANARQFEVIQALVTSDERRNRDIDLLYRQYLGRTADVDGLAFWRGVWGAAGGPELVQAGIISSPEFYNSAGGTDAGWVTALYSRLLNRTVDDEGLAYWVDVLKTRSRSDVVLGFVRSDEYRTNILAGWYQLYFKRSIDDGALRFHLGELRRGVTLDTVQSVLLNSSEFRNRPA